jgi:hypothetical protein
MGSFVLLSQRSSESDESGKDGDILPTPTDEIAQVLTLDPMGHPIQPYGSE